MLIKMYRKGRFEIKKRLFRYFKEFVKAAKVKL